jgi:cytochrome bd ubiquinol oxidase subunit I
LLIPLQIVVGDLHGLNTYHHQPAKLAAMEAIWETQRGAPAVLFALPDSELQDNRMEISIPRLASLYLGHSLDAEVRGLKDFAGNHPPVAPVFWAFRTMVGVGLLMLAVSWTAWWQLRRRGQPGARVLAALVAMTFSGWVALVAGWFVTEIGRQPWLVQGVLSTARAASSTPAPRIALTLTMYLVLYAVLLVAFISVLFHLADKAGHTPPAKDAIPVATPSVMGVDVLADEEDSDQPEVTGHA